MKDLLVNDIEKAKSLLENINWNFYQKISLSNSEIHPFNCRKHHWYPSTFIPEIPFTLIEILTLKGAIVFDPFAGIGTTYFQALLLERRPLTVEICRVAIEFMKSLFILFNPEIDLNDLRVNFKKIINEFDPNIEYISKTSNHILIDLLKPWYTTNTLNQLSFLFIKNENNEEILVKSVMKIIISGILKTVSCQDRGWGCIADNVLPKKEQMKDKNVLDLFSKHLNLLFNDISVHLKNVTNKYEKIYKELSIKNTIFYEDINTFNGIPDNFVDLVITSPPYPNMTDYVTSQRLSYYFLGIDLRNKNNLKEIDLEIGSRRKRTLKNTGELYLSYMNNANKLISNKIKTGGYACFIMPVFDMYNKNNTNRKFIIQEMLSNLEVCDLVREGEYERILPVKRRSHNIKWATLEKEKIYFFRKV